MCTYYRACEHGGTTLLIASRQEAQTADDDYDDADDDGSDDDDDDDDDDGDGDGDDADADGDDGDDVDDDFPPARRHQQFCTRDDRQTGEARWDRQRQVCTRRINRPGHLAGPGADTRLRMVTLVDDDGEGPYRACTRRSKCISRSGRGTSSGQASQLYQF